MIGIDTNILVRIFADDHLEQARRASALIDEEASGEGAFISVIVLVEFAWTMRRAYRWTLAHVLEAIRRMTEHPNVVMEDRDVVREALVHAASHGSEFPDQLIAVRNAASGCRVTMTFDRDASRSAGLELLSA